MCPVPGQGRRSEAAVAAIRFARHEIECCVGSIERQSEGLTTMTDGDCHSKVGSDFSVVGRGE